MYSGRKDHLNEIYFIQHNFMVTQSNIINFLKNFVAYKTFK